MKLKHFEKTDIRTGRKDVFRAKSRRLLDKRLGSKRISEVLVRVIKN